MILEIKITAGHVPLHYAEPSLKHVGLSHTMSIHTPGWVGYAGNKMWYAQNLQTKSIVAQRIDTAMHVGTHLDGKMHATDGMGDDWPRKR